jgi:hypothetical protein
MINNERLKLKEYYEKPSQFVDELNSINVRKLEYISDKELIKKLKRWYKEYGLDMNLYETQYARLQQILKDNVQL